MNRSANPARPALPGMGRLLNPQGVAVIGASRRPEKIGYKIVQNILTVGYRGRILPVNPAGGEVLGIPICRSIDEIAGRAEVAVISIPAPRVLEAAEACAAAGVEFLVVVTSGFSEVGNHEGEEALVALARAHGMRVLGPNVFGFYSARASLNAGFAPPDIEPGRVAILTQSGAMGGAMIGKTQLAHIGLSALIPLGNKADITEADLLDFFAEDPETDIVLIYIEGVKKGRALFEALESTTRHKPVIVIKSGRSQRGAQAAASHTGSLSGSDVIFDHLMRQCGVLRAEHLNEALLWCQALGDMPLPSGENAVIITNGGGAGVAASDACEKYGVSLYDDSEMLEQAFRPITPPLGSTKNPIDMTGEATTEAYHRALAAAAQDENVHACLAIFCETALLSFESLPREIEMMQRVFQERGKPVVFCLLGGRRVEACIRELEAKHVTATDEVYAAASALAVTFRQARRQGRRSALGGPSAGERAPGGPAVGERAPGGASAGETALGRPEVRGGEVGYRFDRAAIAGVVEKARVQERAFLLADEGYAVLRAAGIGTPGTRVAHSLDGAVLAAEELGYPVVMKVLSRDILHKSDVGGVALDLENRNEVIDAYQAIRQNCRRRAPEARLDGVEISSMVKGRGEFIIGARRDPIFGPVVMFGLGGVYVELLQDVAFRAAPAGRTEVLSMIKETRAQRLLAGFRGEAPLDQGAVIQTIDRLGALILRVPALGDIEINPLAVFREGEGATAVDVRILLSRAEE